MTNDPAHTPATGVIPVAESTPIADRTIQALLQTGAAKWPDRPALREGDRIIRFACLLGEAQARGEALAGLGVGFQEPVGLMMDNHLDHVLTWMGATYGGRVQVQVNTAYRGNLLANALNRLAISVLVVDARYVGRIAEIADHVPRLRTVVVRGSTDITLSPDRFDTRDFADIFRAGRLGGWEPEEPVGPWHTYGVIFTSGTTGPSKAVVLPHGLPFGYVSPEHVAMVDADDVVLVPFPQFHISGQWTGVLAPLMVGGHAVVVERFTASGFWDDVRRFNITQTTLLSAMVPFLLAQPTRDDDSSSTLRKVVMAPIVAESAAFANRFGVDLASCYGQTEACLPIVAGYGHTSPGACGWVRPDFDVRIVDEHDNDVSEGEVGELVVRANEPFLSMTEYAGAPEATVEKWRNLWLHTGDMHRRDETGQHYFVDRSVDAIRRRGENISSLEVEAEILTIDGVALVAVIGVESPDHEQEVMACVVLKPSSAARAEDLHAAMRAKLPYFMVPRYIDLLEDLPRTPTQRVQKAGLRVAGVTATAWDARAHGLEARHSN